MYITLVWSKAFDVYWNTTNHSNTVFPFVKVKLFFSFTAPYGNSWLNEATLYSIYTKGPVPVTTFNLSMTSTCVSVLSKSLIHSNWGTLHYKCCHCQAVTCTYPGTNHSDGVELGPSVEGAKVKVNPNGVGREGWRLGVKDEHHLGQIKLNTFFVTCVVLFNKRIRYVCFFGG